MSLFQDAWHENLEVGWGVDWISGGGTIGQRNQQVFRNNCYPGST
jgi:hypothetical protein